nr:DUF3040 domain-containing protein [Actinomycetales bacterium]
MPLSEYEQRVLAQMEQQLRAADPELAESLQASPRGRIDVRRLSLGIVVALIGIGALIAGVATDLVWLGVLGFLGMLVGALLATTLSSGRAEKDGDAEKPSGGSTPKPAGASFMDRQQERWEKRQENS